MYAFTNYKKFELLIDLILKLNLKSCIIFNFKNLLSTLLNLEFVHKVLGLI